MSLMSGQWPSFVGGCDLENGFDPDHAVQNGLTVDSQFSLLKPTFLEDTLKVIELAARSQRYRIIVYDSLAMALPSKDWKNKTYGEDGVIGIQPALLQDFCNRIIPLLFHSQTTLVFVNQPGTSITPWGTYDHTPWLDYPVSISFTTRQIPTDTATDDPFDAIEVLVEVVKNKFGVSPQPIKLHISSKGIYERTALSAGAKFLLSRLR